MRSTLVRLSRGASAWPSCLGSPRCEAQNYPSRVVRIVVPFAAGAPDSVGRILAQQLQTQMGQSVVVENRPAANGVIGTDSVAKAAARRPHAA